MRKLGEEAVTLDGKDYVLSPSFEALQEIENRSGKGILQISFDIAQQKVGINDMAAIIWGGHAGYLKAKSDSDMPWTFKELGELVIKTGIMTLYTDLLRFMSTATTGRMVEEIEEDAKKKDGSEGSPKKK